MKPTSYTERVLDLDDDTISKEKLTIDSRDVVGEIPREMAVVFLQLALRQVLTDNGVAVNLFYDMEDDCLRAVEYFRSEKEDVEFTWRELYPAPGCFAEQVLNEVRWRVAVDAPSGEGTLHYDYAGSRRQAIAMAPKPTEIRLYFTDDRPSMRSKGTP